MCMDQLMFWVAFSSRPLALFPGCSTTRFCVCRFCMPTVFIVCRVTYFWCFFFFFYPMVYRNLPVSEAYASFFSCVEQIPAAKTTDFSLSNKQEQKIEKFRYFIILWNSSFQVTIKGKHTAFIFNPAVFADSLTRWST